MKSYLSISIIFSVLSLFASVGLAEKYTTMKMPDYKNVSIYVESVRENFLGITKERLETKVKLRLLRNGLRESKANSLIGYMYIEVIPLDVVIAEKTYGCAVTIHFAFHRYQGSMTITEPLSNKGTVLLRTNYNDFESVFNEKFDEFILNYLESNIE